MSRRPASLAGLAHAQWHYAAAESPARRPVALRQCAKPPDPEGYAAALGRDQPSTIAYQDNLTTLAAKATDRRRDTSLSGRWQSSKPPTKRFGMPPCLLGRTS